MTVNLYIINYNIKSMALSKPEHEIEKSIEKWVNLCNNEYYDKSFCCVFCNSNTYYNRKIKMQSPTCTDCWKDNTVFFSSKNTYFTNQLIYMLESIYDTHFKKIVEYIRKLACCECGDAIPFMHANKDNWHYVKTPCCNQCNKIHLDTSEEAAPVPNAGAGAPNYVPVGLAPKIEVPKTEVPKTEELKPTSPAPAFGAGVPCSYVTKPPEVYEEQYSSVAVATEILKITKDIEKKEKELSDLKDALATVLNVLKSS